MHTLPVSPWHNIISKLLAAMTWTIVSGIVAMLSIFIFSIGTINYSEILPQLLGSLKQVINELGINLFLLGMEGIVIALTQMALWFIMIYASIALGHLFNKRKILASFGAFIVLNIAMEMLIGIGAKIISIMPFEINLNNSSVTFIANGALISGILINLIFFAGYFAITNYVIKNKLNLE